MNFEAKLWDEMTKRLERIEEKQEQLLITATTLKVKLGIISAFFGVAGSIIADILKGKLNGH